MREEGFIRSATLSQGLRVFVSPFGKPQGQAELKLCPTGLFRAYGACLLFTPAMYFFVRDSQPEVR